MAINFISEGDRVTVAAPSGGVTSGQLVLINSLFGVAQADAASGASVAIVTRGEFDALPKSTAVQVAAVGTVLYWDATSSRLTTTVGSNVRIGLATQAAVTATTTIRALINSD
jgi:predicted RecA/RadA family phage recombinase